MSSIWGDGLVGDRATPGNQGVYGLRRVDGERCEFLLVTLWDDMDAVRAFAGEEPETAVFYPEDDRFLIDRDSSPTTTRWWRSLDEMVALHSGAVPGAQPSKPSGKSHGDP